jgi:hypothetical protein
MRRFPPAGDSAPIKGEEVFGIFYEFKMYGGSIRERWRVVNNNRGRTRQQKRALKKIRIFMTSSGIIKVVASIERLL